MVAYELMFAFSGYNSYHRMGNQLTCPASSSDLEDAIQSILVNSIDLGYNNANRFITFEAGHDTTGSKKSLDSEGKKRNMLLEEESMSFKRGQNESVLTSINEEEVVEEKVLSGSKIMEMDGQLSPTSLQTSCDEEALCQSPDGAKVGNPKHEAAIKLQKVYKSFRTRRQLADCAVLAEQSWQKILDFSELKHSSISFFDIDHHETAVSRWSRAKTRAARVGKGLSKSNRARKLALKHWLEAIDPRHRYGSNLHFYFNKWLDSQSREPFFYWLDVGEGTEADLEKCPRLKLQQQCIKYLVPLERRAYEVAIHNNGKLFYLQSGEILDTTLEPDAKWIFVLSPSKTLYVGKKNKGKFQHSSFLAGGATCAAGRVVVDNGILRSVSPHSGHYKPTNEDLQNFLSYLKENNVDLTNVKIDPIDEDIQPLGKQISSHRKGTCPPKDDLTHDKDESNNTEEMDVGRTVAADAPQQPKHGHFISASGREAIIPMESIRQWINSCEEVKSYQLGKQLSCTWATGAGPRIGCLRDCTSELQAMAPEELTRLQIALVFQNHCNLLGRCMTATRLSPKGGFNSKCYLYTRYLLEQNQAREQWLNQIFCSALCMCTLSTLMIFSRILLEIDNYNLNDQN